MLQRLPEHQPDHISDTAKDDPVFCAGCHHLITRTRWAVSRDGHEHVFSNPRGLVFRIVLYDDAPGISSEGVKVDDFTWFKNFHWQFSLCRGCGEHMGWTYTDGNDGARFFGLIKGNLTDQT